MEQVFQACPVIPDDDKAMLQHAVIRHCFGVQTCFLARRCAQAVCCSPQRQLGPARLHAASFGIGPNSLQLETCLPAKRQRTASAVPGRVSASLQAVNPCFCQFYAACERM